MKITLTQAGTAVAKGAVEAAKLGGSLTAGSIINARVAKIVKEAAPVYARGYIDTDLGKAASGLIGATLLLYFMPDNEKARLVADAMIKSAGVKFVESFNIEEKFNEIIEGLDLSSLTPAVEVK